MENWGVNESLLEKSFDDYYCIDNVSDQLTWQLGAMEQFYRDEMIL